MEPAFWPPWTEEAATQAFDESVAVAEGLPLGTRYLDLVLEEAVLL
jgi:hypothetical protein